MSGSTSAALARKRKRQRLACIARRDPLVDRVIEIVGRLVAIARGDAPVDARLVDLDHQGRCACELAGQRLRAAHAAAARGQQQPPGERATEMRAPDRHEGLVGALQDALAADVLPGAGGHARHDGEAHVIEAAPVLLAAPLADDVAVGHDHQRRRRLAREDADRLAGLDDEGLVVAHAGQRRDNAIEGVPITRGARDRHVDHEVVRILGVLQVVLQESQDRFLAPTLAAQRGAAPGGDLAPTADRNVHGSSLLAICVSRAQRSAKRCAADPGPYRTISLWRSRISGAPLRKSFALHRIRDTASYK